uniref:Uncharacterized protein n=1 Tax=Chromera velia CCMP2878 TaxID=1169474 RepID=A0A0G4G5V4_9ALVE|mmetsp:Transcript_56156/g.109942  ORF Transcript_56156/g.109942 Transcript_56156/m.109942 type:complete len:222 (-) Transcript_56156:503-1168(-)|eukprot:Cvel_4213.t1-p1 / transcript=Cvel_4213.t1 / gene=Cvel_4213 / organism=Chromera_velia_CCMP2878 / gene_product=hypothetical protein / transcript_product=hypothetical protein / location=Cvel_scaffold182:23417-24079(+) / protein_length=221 / sequence_SO=supercontig / SO=protein_coding / is_pseudo=false
MGSDKDALKTGPDGLPLIPEKDKKFNPVFFGLFYTIPVLVGLGIAYAIFAFGSTAVYTERISAVVAADLHWAFAAVAVLSRVVSFVNFYPMVYKNKIMGSKAKNLRSNPYLYKAIGDGAANNVIIFADGGDLGAYNRAQRSLHHMIENFAVILAGLFLVSQVFPFPVFVCTCVFGLGRILHQVGYTTGYGGHALGFMLSFITCQIIEGMCILVALKGLGVL